MNSNRVGYTKHKQFLRTKRLLRHSYLWMPQDPNLTTDQVKVLKIFERTFLCYIIEDASAKACRIPG